MMSRSSLQLYDEELHPNDASDCTMINFGAFSNNFHSPGMLKLARFIWHQREMDAIKKKGRILLASTWCHFHLKYKLKNNNILRLALQI